MLAVDTTQATASNRIKLYINGEQETSFSTSNYMSQNYDTYFNVNSKFHRIGGRIDNVEYFDGLMAHVHFIDGTAYDADTFGETDSTSGIWKPKTGPSVTYGTNGFFLKFQDSSSLGDDSSGNTNDFTLSGSGIQILDTPSNMFNTGNSLSPYSNRTISNGNLTLTSTTTAWTNLFSTLGVSTGKWYAELKATAGSYHNFGIVDGFPVSANASIGDIDDVRINQQIGYYSNNGKKYVNQVSSTYGDSWTNGDIIGVALDLDNNYIYFSKNGTWQNSGVPTSGSSGTGGISVNSGYTYFIGASAYGSSETSFNFGNGYFKTTAVSSAENDDAGYGKFEYDVPTGYYALCTKNINTYG